MLLGKFRMRVAGVLMATAIMGFGAPSAGLAETLKIGGTGGALGTMQILGRAFEKQHAGVSVEILPSLGSGGGIKAVLAGAIDIGLSARRLKAKERDAGVEVDIDPERLRRAVINPIDNACQAVTDGAADGGRERGIAVETRAADGHVELAVADTGSGIPADVLPKVFEPLFSTKGFGVGLGLPMVKQIVEQHRGGIEISSEEGRGTRVVLWLPTEASGQRQVVEA